MSPTSRTVHVWPLVAASALFVAALGLALTVSLRQNGGHLAYALDDPYIHMAMAKNVALHGVWGVSASHFSSSSSSLLWTAGLATLFFAFGVHQFIPLALNVLLAIMLLIVVFRSLARADIGLSPSYVFLVLTGIALTAPLPGLVFVGQEHILHALVNLTFVGLAAFWLSQSGRGMHDPVFRRLCLLALILPLIRYEALFVVAIVSVMLLAQRRWAQGLILVVLACIPVGLYGALSGWAGWYWLPNSVILKGTRPDLFSLQGAVEALGYVSYSRLRDLPAVAFLLYSGIAAFIFRLARGANDQLQWMLAIFIMLTLLHTQFAQPGAFWFFRYEAYLVVLGCVVLARAFGEWLTACQLQEWSRTRKVGLALASVLLFAFSPLPDRAAKALVRLPRATTNIYEQQYQMGLFLKRFYEGTPVALNDIGAASYLGDIECVDLVGLANMDVAKRILNGEYENEDIREITEASGASIGVVYDSWFGGRIPVTWRRVGTWTIRNNVVEGSDTVTFYAIRPEAFAELGAHLRDFARELPANVVQRY